MVQKINRLSVEVINKIAAGEVVENPASIAKELIENSLDAGAKQIDLSIEQGGCALLRIEDDGCGMGPEDALLSLERHATSKIRTERDLTSLGTMGFRGEALAAVAAVSRFELKTSDGDTGTHIEAEGGTVSTCIPCARNRGTSVTVRDLFFNTPARKKFLKTPSANGAALARIVETIALAHPEIGFSLKMDGKTSFQASPEEKKKRIETLLGPMPHETVQSELWGLFAPPEEAKVHRRGQYLFINKRPVFSPLISRAVKTGYGTRIDEHAHPSFVLFLDLDPELVDVNVHPQKKEVRFSSESSMFQMVEQAVAAAFGTPAPLFSRTLSFSSVPFSFEEPLPVSPRRFDAPSLPFETSSIAERPLAIVDGYFFLQAEGLLLIDLRLAHTRVLYESLANKKSALQSLLWPIEIAIEEEGIVEELLGLGIECRLIGKKTLAVDALPSLLDPDDFPSFLNAWREGKKLDLAVRRSVLGSKKIFQIEEALLLWRQLLKCADSLYDPGGRRIWSRIDAEKLKKMLEGP